MNTAISNLSSKQLRRAANIKDKIESLRNKLAKILGAADLATADATPKRKPGMSAAGRRRIAAAQRARWAKINTEKSKSAPAQKPKRKMSAAARAKIAAAQKARWAKLRGKA